MSISLDEVRHVARLARIELGEVELFALQGELNSLLGYFADIETVDTTGVELTSHVAPLFNVWAVDEPGATLPREVALRNAALTKAGLFVVPAILEG
ncbi:MAG: Asp-tRNA(Asn)/Glu-tRNA(Gln) amidotransferase subunit GatC [Fimbriimonadaceae bacterium]